MNIKVKKVDSSDSYFTGGECAVCDLMIEIDTNLPLELQQDLVIHAILENYNRSTPHNKIEELVELIREGLNQLG